MIKIPRGHSKTNYIGEITKNHMEDTIEHYGIKRKSGRYPWGSGEDPYQSESWYKFHTTYQKYRDQGLTQSEIAKKMGMNTRELRDNISWTRRERENFIRNQIQLMKEQGLNNTEMSRILNISEGTVRNYISNTKPIEDQWANIEKTIIESMDRTGYLDIGMGVERQLGIPRSRFNTIVNKIAKEHGLTIEEVYTRRLSDLGKKDAKWTTVKVLTRETDKETIYKNKNKIRPIESWSDDNGATIHNIKDPKVVPRDRIHVRYVEEGGADKDGLIEVKPGVEDLNLGLSKYAQVRIATENKLYLKGMAAYSDPSEFPKGKDLIYNVTKEKGTPDDSVFKKMEKNADNPFGTTIARQRGAMNIVNEEGDWDTWSGKLSSQFLSKQPPTLIKDRLDTTYDILKKEYDEINNLTNEVVKEHLMREFSDGLDSKARHLKAQGLPRTKSHVLLPSTDINPNEIYAPSYKHGEQVVLVRHPHGGVFEIPRLTVNNKNEAARKIIGSGSPDAVVIHPSQGDKLSGADFDGDTVLVIPNNDGKIKTARSLKELKNFEPTQYKVNHKTISKETKEMQMGIVSNLITDMTIKGATPSELARAVKHSMVVIDAEKHNLDYKQSARDNGIAELRKRYQTRVNPETGRKSQGASTLISRSKHVVDISSDTFDVNDYTSDTAVDALYGSYVTKVQRLKQDAEKSIASVKPLTRSREAAKVYSEEVESLNRKLNTALLNKPRERQAQLLSVKLYYDSVTTDMDKDDKKKLATRSLGRARDTVGAKKEYIDITDREWEAIQAGAVSKTVLKDILDNAKSDQVKRLATPRHTILSPSKENKARTLLDKGYSPGQVAESVGARTSDITNLTMSEAKVSRARSMLNSGMTYEEVAKVLGVSTTTISKAINK